MRKQDQENLTLTGNIEENCRETSSNLLNEYLGLDIRTEPKKSAK